MAIQQCRSHLHVYELVSPKGDALTSPFGQQIGYRVHHEPFHGRLPSWTLE